jgi:23S rRNA pseudouridine1911/1915/1917 synthase
VTRQPLDILFEDNHLLVIDKPAGIPTQGAQPSEESMVTLAKDYIKHRYQKPGNVYLGVVSRLDALVSGVLIFARTSKAAARLSEQFREAETHKRYWAIVSGHPQPPSASLTDWLLKDESQHCMKIVPARTPQAQEARLQYRCLQQLNARHAWLEVTLETGRKHQIRVQLASHGWPILGDAKYGSRESFPHGIALHARSLRIEHPTQHTSLEFQAPVPASWRKMGHFEA